MISWHQLDTSTVLTTLASHASHGLSDAEAQHRLANMGTNELLAHNTKPAWQILWAQFTSTLVVVLIVAALVSGLLGDLKDTVAILAIVLLNALLGFRQEYQAEHAMAALKKLAAPVVKVRRNGHVRTLSARELVPGDVILLEAGALIPADSRLLESINLRVQEATLTGESEPVEKNASERYAATQALAERRNMVYMGTMVTYGRGEAVVTATAMQTELGRLADAMQAVEREPTPLQQRLETLGRNLALVALSIVLVIFAVGIIQGQTVRLMLLTAVSMAVAAVPEGLPAIVTIALALGAQRMLKRHALVRKLPAVETLGSVTVICSDKTGTLTENRMTVTMLDVAGGRIDLTEEITGDHDSLITVLGNANITAQPALMLLLAGGALCNDVSLHVEEQAAQRYHLVGDPTEGALAVAAARAGLLKPELDQFLPRVAELPFDAQRKRMTTIHRRPATTTTMPASLAPLWALPLFANAPAYLMITKGAFDGLLTITTKIWVDNQIVPLDATQRQRINKAHDELAQQGMRVLGLAMRGLDQLPESGPDATLEQEMIFIGLIGMIDPPRAEVKLAVQTCQRAGIRPMMITGDHPLTARHIAQQLAIGGDSQLLTGAELDQLSPEELRQVVEKVAIYARVSPTHKLNIVEALQQRGHVVAMTGDGVNDAPALKKADIGIAMGITGADVAKEAAEMVLQDDNFATIVAAVEEGRVIYDNIRKFIKYLLSCNSGELWVMLLAPLLGMPLPLLPLQILWMNLVTDGLPALALGVEQAERNAMRRPPYLPQENIFSRGIGRDILWIGLLMGLMPLALGYFYWQAGHAAWQTLVFTTLTLSQLALALALRSEHDSLFQIGFATNRLLLAAVGLTLGLQLAVIYWPVMQQLFATVPLTLSELLVSLTLATLIFWGVELQKWLQRHWRTTSSGL